MFPHLLHIYGPIAIQSYGAMVLLGFSLSLWLIFHHPRRRLLLNDDQFFSLTFWAFMGGIIGGRLFFVAMNWPDFSPRPWAIFFLPEGGLVATGMIVGGVMGILAALRKNLWHALQCLDLAAVYFPLAHSIGRIGCLLAGCCYGKIMAKPTWWSITFTRIDSFLPDCFLHVPLYPTQILSALASFSIFGILWFFSNALLGITGAALALGIFLETVARIVLDCFRADSGTEIVASWLGMPITYQQTVSLACGITLLIPLIFFIIQQQRHART